MSQVHLTPLQLRFADTDGLGHLNNAVYASYAELARLTFLGAVGVEVESLILARLEIDFRRQAHVKDELVVRTWVERIGTTSLVMAHEVVRGGEEVVASIRTVVVHFDYATNQSVRVPDVTRQLLSTYVVELAGQAQP